MPKYKVKKKKTIHHGLLITYYDLGYVCKRKWITDIEFDNKEEAYAYCDYLNGKNRQL